MCNRLVQIQIFKVLSKAWLLMHELKKYFLWTLFIKLASHIHENYIHRWQHYTHMKTIHNDHRSQTWMPRFKALLWTLSQHQYIWQIWQIYHHVDIINNKMYYNSIKGNMCCQHNFQKGSGTDLASKDMVWLKILGDTHYILWSMNPGGDFSSLA